MKCTLGKALIFCVLVARASGLNAQSRGPAQITLEGAMKVPSQLIAIGYRVTTDKLPLLELARKGMGLSISELGQANNVNTANAEDWIEGYKRRQDIYAAVIESRGYVDVSGSYDLRTIGDCGTLFEAEVKIAQSAFTLQLSVGGKGNSTGTVAESYVVVNFGGTVGDVPYWTGEFNNQRIVLTDFTGQSGKCSLEFRRK
jgi:hypothetical protein